MSQNLLDNLARALVQPMPRRRALRVLGISLTAALVPGVRPPLARGSGRIACYPNPCGPKGRCCTKSNGDEYCCGPNGNFYWCGGSQNGYRCIDKCKLAGREAGTGPWTRCGEELCCIPKVQVCRKGACVPCQPGKPLCGGECCPSGESCQKCVESQQGSVIWFVKGGRKCCPPDSECCGSTCYKKSLGRVCCNGKLCRAGKRCVNVPPSSGRVGLTCG
jgi:hypothetical protein